jgi:uncharacterized delta-60 repeat protein
MASAVAVQPDGSIVVAGTVGSNGNDTDFGVLRLTADGAPDTNWGPEGKQHFGFNLGGSNADKALGLALQPDGKLVVVGSVEKAAGDTDFGVARLENDHFRFASPNAAGFEGAAVTLTVERVGGSTGTASVLVSTAGGTAAPGQDYTPVSQLLTFANGETTKTVTLSLKADIFAEGLERVQLVLSNPQGAGVDTPGTALVLIADWASPPLQDVSPLVKVLLGKAKRVGGRYRQRVTLVNVGPQALHGPLALVLDGLKKPARVVKAQGKTLSLAPVGSPYLVLDPGPGPLQVGQARTFVIRFRSPNSKKIAYTPRVLAGVGIP